MEGRAKADGIKAETAAPVPAETSGIMGPERPEAEPRSLADATAQLRSEQDAAQAPTSGAAPEAGEARDMAADLPGGGHDGPLPVPGSVDDPYGPPLDPAPGAAPHAPSISHEAEAADPKHGATGR